MGVFAQATAALPLPPAQAEAMYDLLLDDENIEDGEDDKYLSDRDPDRTKTGVRHSVLTIITNEREARPDRELQTVLVENPEPETLFWRRI